METATQHKESTEGLIAALRAEADQLVGREHHAERAAKGKSIARLRSQERYIDACRVAKGLAPMHGHFATEAERSGAGAVGEVRAEEAARLAREAEKALKKLDMSMGAKAPPSPAGRSGNAADPMSGWWRRVAKLEAKLAGPLEPGAADADELEQLAEEVVDHRRRCVDGGKGEDVAADHDLQLIEARLDTLAGAFLPADRHSSPGLEAEAKELRQWEQRLVAKLAHRAESSAHLKPSAAKEMERLLEEVAELKATLRAQGLTEREQDKDERVLLKLTRLAELRQYEHHDKKQERQRRQESDGLLKELDQLGSKVQAYKQRLRQEKGYSHKDLKIDPEVCELEERHSTLLRMGGA